jgi:hypothetical protein
MPGQICYRHIAVTAGNGSLGSSGGCDLGRYRNGLFKIFNGLN